MPDSRVHLFGIRHHGPGSAHSLVRALEELRPDALLIEGPPDAEPLLHLVVEDGMQPPVALLVYARDEPSRAVFYPFAVFSPEWQALRYGLGAGIPVRFMDLPQTHALALEAEEARLRVAASSEVSDETDGSDPSDNADPPEEQGSLEAPAVAEDNLPQVRRDPLYWLARAAGFGDGERWWEHMVEHRVDGEDLFAAIAEAMSALRDELGDELRAADEEEAHHDDLREAWMRRTLREALKEGYQRIAVVCGAWHVPALSELPPAKADDALLKGMPKLAIAVTWSPWTYDRLGVHSGYGAGVHSPGWYDHLWTAQDRPVIRWMAKVANLMREQGLDASPASVIEAVRLAEALSALRSRPLPGLQELNEAILAVLCGGDELPMRLIYRQLIVGDRLGAVPESTPMAPLQQELRREQKRLRLPTEASRKELDLDLRKPNDLERSHLLHRLNVLGVPWGDLGEVSGKSGTFHELWSTAWQPEFEIRLIEAGSWGSTLIEAATTSLRRAVEADAGLPILTRLLDQAILGALPAAVSDLLDRIRDQAAVSGDLGLLMDALPPLARIARYGNVRQTDPELVTEVVDGLVARICVGLTRAVAAVNDDAAGEWLGRLLGVHGAIALLSDEEHLAAWRGTLRRVADRVGVHGLLAGRATRLLLEAGELDSEEAGRRLGLSLSRAADAAQAGAWFEGFLGGGGILLLHDDRLWALLDAWLSGLRPDFFQEVLPLLRRTFATYEAAEKRQLGEKARRGSGRVSARGILATDGEEFDVARAQRAMPLVLTLLGLTPVATEERE